MSVEEVLRAMQLALEAAGIPYMVTGSFAGAVHGDPRATKDIDIIIDPTREQLVAFITLLAGDRYYAQLEAAIDALEHRNMFNILDLTTGWRVDLIFRKDRPFSAEEFSRRTAVDFGELRLPVASPEDLLLAKLEWGKLGESERQLQDAASIIRVQAENLDVAYVERWVRELGLEAQWEAARALST